MGGLSNYIKKTISLSKYVNEIPNSIFDHFFIEFGFDSCNEFILEKYGKYDGQIELVQALVNDIYDSRNTDKSLTFTINDDEAGDFPGIFYHKLNIIYDPKTKKTAYLPLENNFDKEDKKMNAINIILSVQKNFTKQRIFKSIMHELTHAWHDYNSYINKGKSLISLGEESKYYNSIRKTILNTSAESLCKNLMYLLTKFERNAYLSEIYAELDQYEGEIISWKDAKKVFEQSSTYQNIMKLYDALKDIKNKDTEYQKEFIEFYNRHNQTSLTLNKIVKILDDKLNKMFDKIMKTCSKIYYEWTQKQEIEDSILEYYSLEDNF